MLLMTLAVIGFLSIIVLALFTMLFTDVATRSSYARAARDQRAADGALQIGIDRLKTSPGGSLGGAGGCTGLTGSQVTLDSRVVTLSCGATAITDPPIASPGLPGDGPALTLLGNYNGQLDDVANGNLGTLLGVAASGLAVALNDYLLQGPGLVHYGPGSLKVVGDVDVKQSALGRKDPTPSPAFDVTGNYRQGDVGLLGNQSFSIFGVPILSTPACGVLDRNVGTGTSDLGLQLHATGTATCNVGRGNIPTPTMNAPATFSESARRLGTDLPISGCVSDTVVQFTPGAYNRLQTQKMNEWFSRSNTVCHNVTFYFPHGDYYFDSGGYFNGDRNALAFDDPTSNWVFGTPKGWSPPARATAAAFPEACDRSAPGVSITTSARTALKHKGGRVAICGTPGSSTTPAIYQDSGSVTQDWAGAATVATNSQYTDLGKFSSLPDATHSLSPAPATYPAYGSDWDGSEGTTRRSATISCQYGCTAGLRFSGFSDPGEPAPSGTLTKAVLKIRGHAENIPGFGVPAYGVPSTTVIVYYGDGSQAYNVCQINVNDIPRNYDENFLTINLLTGCNNGTYQLIDATQLENAQVEVHMALPLGLCAFCTAPTPKEYIDYVWMETSTTAQPSSSYSTVVNPAGGSSMNVFGPVYVPKSQIEVGWTGSANTLPVFVGQVVARGLGSLGADSSVQVGVLASRTLVQPRRHVTLRAEIDGRLRGIAEVEITDVDSSSGSPVQTPGWKLEIVDWDLCNREQTAPTC